MSMQTLLFSLILSGATVIAQTAPSPPEKVAPTPSESATPDEDILAIPPGFKDFVVKATLPYQGYTLKTRALVQAVFAKPEDGGLGLVYSNDKTRTVTQVWNDRRANCLSLTAFYVAACRAIQVDVKFADSAGINHWVRKGDFIFHERHVVAVLPVNVIESMVADFSAEPRTGAHQLVFLPESRFLSLFHSNRAVELLRAGDPEGAWLEAQASVHGDPSSGIGWNIFGVVAQKRGEFDAAEKAFRKALEVDPKDGSACGNLEELCRSQGRFSEADEFHQLGLKVRDADPYFHAFIAKNDLASGDINSALSHIKRALSLQRMEPDFYLILAQAELDRGERQAAERAVEKAIHWSLPDQKKRMESKLAMIQGQS